MDAPLPELHMHLPSRNIALIRATGIASIAAPSILWVMFFVMGLSRPGYNLITSAASNLGAQGTPNWELFNVGFFISGGLLTALAGMGLLRMMGSNSFWRIGGFLAVIGGMLLMLTGLVPTYGAGPVSSSLHGIFSQSCFVAVSVAPLFLYKGMPTHLVPRWAKKLWLRAGMATVFIELFDVTLNRWVGLPYGVFQRSFMLALTLSFIAVGLWLIQHRPLEHFLTPAYAEQTSTDLEPSL